MLSTQQSIREQVDALTSTIYTHLSTISQESKAAIKKADDGDQSVNADQVVSKLVHNLNADLQQHDQVKSSSKVVSVEYGSQITPGDFPQESSEEVKEVQQTQEEKILQKVQSQDKQARKVLSELFEIYEQMMSEITKVMTDQKSQFDKFETNGMLQKSQVQRSQLIKSQSSLLLEQGSDYPQNLVNNLDTSMKELLTKQIEQVSKDVDQKTLFIDQFLSDLEKSSKKAVNYLVTSKKPEIIVTRWTERMFNTGFFMKLVHPKQRFINQIKKLDVESLDKIALDKLWISSAKSNNDLYGSNSDRTYWNFEFMDNKKSDFCPADYPFTSKILDANKDISSVAFYANQNYDFLSGLAFSYKDKQQLIVGTCSRLIKTVNLDANEKIIGVKARYNPTFPDTIGDIQFLVAKISSAEKNLEQNHSYQYFVKAHQIQQKYQELALFSLQWVVMILFFRFLYNVFLS